MVLKFIRPFRPTRPEPEPTTVPTVASDERVYVIGDIHGRQDLLIRLLKQINEDALSVADARRVRLVFLGDYIDRGDSSRQVIDTLIKLNEGRPQGLTFLLGNHEAAMLAFLNDPVENKTWLNFGASQTLASYGVPAPRSRPDNAELERVRDDLDEALGAHVDFLKTLKPMARSGNVIFAHAGINPNRGLHEQRMNDLIWGHPEFLTDDPLPGYRVVHGHYDDADPVIHPGRLCIDTGAYYTSRLTAVRLDEGEAIIDATVPPVL